MERRFVAIGLWLVVVMQAVFVATGGDRGALDVIVNALGVLATSFAAWGLPRAEHPGALIAAGSGFGALALLRVLNVVLDLTRVALPISILMALGWGLAAWGALSWGLRPRAPRDAMVRTALWLLGAAYFLALGTTISSGRLSAIGALLVGTVGLFLAAPNVVLGTSGDSGPRA